MQYTKKKHFARPVAVIACLLLVACLLPMLETGSEASDAEQYAAAGLYDAPALYELLIGEDVPEYMGAYLTHEVALSFDCRTLTHGSDVAASYVEEGLALECHALTVTKDGVSARLVPLSAIFRGQTLTFEKTTTDLYTLLFPVESGDALLEECTVRFVCTLMLDGESADLLLNGAYRQARELARARAAYDGDKASYDEALRLYEDYLDRLEIYERDSALYREASEAYARYLRALDAYAAYEKAREAYLAQLAAYEAYGQAQWRYENEQKAYELAYEAFLSYEEQAALYRTQKAQYEANVDRLTALESAYLESDEGHVFYSTLMGNTVTTVVQNKDEIIRAAGDWDGLPAAIDAADLATRNLRILLTEYRQKTTHEEKYTYYRAHYTEIKENFQSLYSSLKHLFDNQVVRARITQEGKRERYKQFIAHLFVISSCLDDKVALDTSYTIDGSSIESLVTGVTRIADTRVADPSAFPLVSEPTPPEGVTRPTAPTPPTPVAKPSAPTEVKAPTPVPAPGNAPIPPAAVESPGDAPIPPVLTASDTALLAAYDDGRLTEREMRSPCEATITLETSVIPTLDGVYTVAYYDESGGTLLYSERVEIGGAATYVGEAPAKPSDLRYDYIFRGFCDASGMLYEDGFTPSGNLRLYASFEENAILYDVTFDVDGETVTAKYPYGAIPTAPTHTQKNPDAEYVYTFVGFEPQVGRVTGSCTYTAAYTTTKRTYTIIYNVAGCRYETRLPYGSLPECPVPTEREMDGVYAYEFLGFFPTVSMVTDNAVYTAMYRKNACAVDASGTPLPVEASDTALLVQSETDTVTLSTLLTVAADVYKTATVAAPSYTLTVSPENADALARAGACTVSFGEADGKWTITFADAQGNALTDLRIAVQLAVKIGICDEERLCVFSGGGALLPFTLDGEMLALTLNDGYTFTLKQRASVLLHEHEGGTLKPSVALADLFVGDTLTLTPAMRYGYRFLSVSVLYTASGEVVTLDGDTLVLPLDALEILPQFERMTYTVTYVDGDTVLSQKTYAFGDEEDSVPSPVKEGLHFLRWEESGRREDGAVTYTAVFTEMEQADPDVTYKKDYGGWHFRDYIPHAIAVLALITAITVGTVIWLKRRKRRKK